MNTGGFSENANIYLLNVLFLIIFYYFPKKYDVWDLGETFGLGNNSQNFNWVIANS